MLDLENQASTQDFFVGMIFALLLIERILSKIAGGGRIKKHGRIKSIQQPLYDYSKKGNKLSNFFQGSLGSFRNLEKGVKVCLSVF